jgi:hypothetical protein
MKLPSPTLVALSVSLLAVATAHAMDKRQADAICAAWKLECPEGATPPSGPAKKSGVLECKARVKGRVVKEGPAVTCREGEAQAFGDWKGGKKHGRHVTMKPDGSWAEEDFAEGKLEGRQVEYSAEGQLLKDTRFQGGKKHGPARTYTEDGKLASEEQWEKGLKAKKAAVARSRPSSEEEGTEEASEGEEAPAEAPAEATAETPAPAAEGDAQATSPTP